MNTKKLLLLSALFITFGIMAQEANLTMKPVAKSKYNVEVTSQVNVVQNMAGMEMKVNANTLAKGTMEIENVAANGNFTVLSTWNEMKANTSAMGKDTTVSYDNLNFMVRTEYDKSGKIIKNERIGKINSSDETMAMMEQVASGIKFHQLPAKAVSKNDTWSFNSNDTINMGGMGMQMISTSEDKYTFVGKETKEGVEFYRVNMSGPAKITGSASQMGMEMTIEGTGMGEGYSLIDKKTVFPAEIVTNLGLDMSIIVSGPQSMSIPMTQNVVSTIKLTEIK